MITALAASALIGALTLCFVTTFRDFQRAKAAVKYLPGYVTVLDMASNLGSLYPTSTRLVMGRFNLWTDKFRRYDVAGWDIISAISLYPRVNPSLILADADAVRDVCTQRDKFAKPVKLYSVLAMFGPNIVVSDGPLWRKFRRVAGPAFNEKNNELVWDETFKIVADLVEQDPHWRGKKTVHCGQVLDVTLEIALKVLGSAAFGKTGDSLQSRIPGGHRMAFIDALKIVSVDVFLYVATGDWLPNFLSTNRVKRVRLAFKEIQGYMSEMIREKESSLESLNESADLFSNLIRANHDPDIEDRLKLTEEELIGNIFIFLVAGHETSAHTLCYAFALLALHPEVQETASEELTKAWPESKTDPKARPTYTHLPKFGYFLAILLETLRMFPSVIGIPKICTEDTVIRTSNARGESLIIPVSKGTGLSIHATGLHYNPRYWPEPHEFRPERFMKDDWNRDAFVAFSAGARSCIGRKFSETESVAVLVAILSRYQITVTEDEQFAEESMQERKERVLATASGITLTPKRVPLTFTRRF